LDTGHIIGDFYFFKHISHFHFVHFAYMHMHVVMAFHVSGYRMSSLQHLAVLG